MTDEDRDQIRERHYTTNEAQGRRLQALLGTLVVTLIAMGLGGLVWVGGLDRTVEDHGRRIGQTEEDIRSLRNADAESLRDRSVSVSERAAIVREMTRLAQIIDRLETRVDRVEDEAR